MRAHVALSSADAVLLGLLLFIVFVLDHPFGTRVGVASEPFQHALERSAHANGQLKLSQERCLVAG